MRTRISCLPMVVVAVVGVIVLGVLYSTFAVPWMHTWGATTNEVRIALPGDEFVPNPMSQTTQAVTIRARSEKIYPWLMQIGVDRGGMYSYDWLENLMGLNVHTIDRIVPELQNVKPGDFWRFTPPDHFLKDGPGVYVMRLEPNRWILGCFGTPKAVPPPCTSTWQLVLQPQDDGSTRLILRTRTSGASPTTGVFGVILDPMTFVMGRGMLLGFRDRVEAAGAVSVTVAPSPTASIATAAPERVPAGLSWSEASQLIRDGMVIRVAQSHALMVTLTFADGSTRTTIEPVIDDVIRVVRECGDRCKNVAIMTE